MILVKAGEPVAWNSQACRMLDWTSKSAGVTQVWAVDGGLWSLEGDEVGLFESKVERALQGNPAKMRCRVVRQTGSMFDAEWKAVPVGDGTLLLQIRDISERMVYEQVIRDSEQRFRTLARHAMEGIAFLEGNQIVDANEQFAILFGWQELPIGEDILNLVNTRDWQRLGARKFARSRVELQGITQQGRTIHLEATRSTDATTNQTVLMVYDITERKRTELDLLQTKERFRMLVETSPIGLLLMVNGKVKYTNPGVLDLMGIRMEDEVYDERFHHPVPRRRPGGVGRGHQTRRTGGATSISRGANERGQQRGCGSGGEDDVVVPRPFSGRSGDLDGFANARCTPA